MGLLGRVDDWKVDNSSWQTGCDWWGTAGVAAVLEIA